MAEPAVRSRTMPVLDFGRNIDAIARFHFDRRLAFFLIITASGNANNDLTAAVFGMMDVPIVAAARFEGDVVNSDLTRRQSGKPSLWHVLSSPDLHKEDLLRRHSRLP